MALERDFIAKNISGGKRCQLRAPYQGKYVFLNLIFSFFSYPNSMSAMTSLPCTVWLWNISPERKTGGVERQPTGWGNAFPKALSLYSFLALGQRRPQSDCHWKSDLLKKKVCLPVRPVQGVYGYLLISSSPFCWGCEQMEVWRNFGYSLHSSFTGIGCPAS